MPSTSSDKFDPRSSFAEGFKEGRPEGLTEVGVSPPEHDDPEVLDVPALCSEGSCEEEATDTGMCLIHTRRRLNEIDGR